MADEQAIPIPQGLDLCGNQSDLNLFLEVLNANFELAASLSETEQSTTLTLPGLPMVAIPGYPYPIGAQKEALDTAWIGGRYPIGSPAGKFSAQGNAPGLNLGATNGLQFAVNAIGYNFQIIANALPTVVTELVTVPMLSFDPCKVPGGPDALINQLNQQLENLVNQIKTGGGGPPPPPPPDCPGITLGDFDGACWERIVGDGGAGFVTATTFNVSSTHHFNPETSIEGTDGVTFLCPLDLGTCRTLKATGHIELSGTWPAEAFPGSGRSSANLLFVEWNTPGGGTSDTVAYFDAGGYDFEIGPLTALTTPIAVGFVLSIRFNGFDLAVDKSVTVSNVVVTLTP